MIKVTEMDLCKKNKNIFWHREGKNEFFDQVSTFLNRQQWGETKHCPKWSSHRNVEPTPPLPWPWTVHNQQWAPIRLQTSCRAANGWSCSQHPQWFIYSTVMAINQGDIQDQHSFVEPGRRNHLNQFGHLDLKVFFWKICSEDIKTTGFLRGWGGHGSSKEVHPPPKNLGPLYLLLTHLCQNKINASSICANQAITERYSVFNFGSKEKIRWSPNEP